MEDSTPRIVAKFDAAKPQKVSLEVVRLNNYIAHTAKMGTNSPQRLTSDSNMSNPLAHLRLPQDAKTILLRVIPTLANDIRWELWKPFALCRTTILPFYLTYILA